MRVRSRAAVSMAVAILLSLSLALPASANWVIEYRGETSAPSFNRVKAYVNKQDNGRRILQYLSIQSIVTCEDATTSKIQVSLRVGQLAEDGSFSKELNIQDGRYYIRMDGTIGFRHGTGTWVFNTTKLTQDGSDAQLCTTGEQTWTVERIPRTQSTLSAKDIPEVGDLKVRVFGR
jgi:hypothetical protein